MTAQARIEELARLRAHLTGPTADLLISYFFQGDMP